MSKAKSKEVESIPEELEYIEVIGARENNLKNISLKIPKNKLVVITGISGSGKSSLAFQTIYAEGQRRYLESFSAYARNFIGGLERPDVDKITGLSPVISIEQKSTNKNPRSTVGTITEIYDFLRLLYARVGVAYSYHTGKAMVRFTEDQIIEQLFKDYKDKKIIFLAPVVKGRKGHYREVFETMRAKGFLKVRIDGETQEMYPKMQVDRYKTHNIEVEVDKLTIKEENKDRIRKSLEQCMKLGEDITMFMNADTEETFYFSKTLMCPETGISYPEPSPNTFSFNSPFGYCECCHGLGFQSSVLKENIIPDDTKTINAGAILPLGEVRENTLFQQMQYLAKREGFSLSEPVKKIPEEKLNIILFGNKEGVVDNDDILLKTDKWYTLDFGGVVGLLKRCFVQSDSDSIRNWAESFMTQTPCDECKGARLRKESLHYKIDEKNIAELSEMDLQQLFDWFDNVEKRLDKKQNIIAKDLLKEIRDRIEFLLNVGLDYLCLHRQTKSLSGGEAQRIRLATQIGSQLVGITYILDEPSIGLHQRDNQKLIATLKNLRDLGNTVIVVEHDKEIMEASDYIIDIGPKAGKGGGDVIAAGTPADFLNQPSTTAAYLKGTIQIQYSKNRRKPNGWIELKGCKGNNLKDVSVKFPLGIFTCVTGVSGGGKSTLVNETLYPILSKYFYKSHMFPLTYSKIEGIDQVDKVIEIDQSPIGRTPRSNPATYIKVFDDIRNLFAIIPEAKIRGYKTGRFSFNVKGGRCETCEGAGMRTIEMNFLPDILVPCERCGGKRYNRETLEIRYKHKSIADVLGMNVDEAVPFFEHIPKIYTKLKTLQDVGLGYLTLGQSSTTLSGGEAQRVKLSSELSKRDTGKTFYILDEPTTGLHFQDIMLLLDVLQKLVEKGNSVLVIEHNLDVIKVADYIIDMGPEGGNKGGMVVAVGTPEEVIKVKESITGRYLKMEMK
jgi:excinuclease ABC subunit A